MRCFVHFAALSVWAGLAASAPGQTTPAPPDWADAGGSVYLVGQPVAIEKTPPTNDPSPPALAPNAPALTPVHNDSAVLQAVHRQPASAPANDDHRRLAPPTAGPLRSSRDNGSPAAAAGRTPSLPRFGVPAQSIYTIASALAIVIGGFLVFACLLRRGTRRRTNTLPTEVVSVLGRLPLAGRQFAELLRVGNKLVLVSLSPTGADTLTEVTDPVEVDRLVGLCQQDHPHSTTKAFEQVFHQLSRETSPPGFLGDDLLPSSLTAAGAYRAHRGEAAHA